MPKSVLLSLVLVAALLAACGHKSAGGGLSNDCDGQASSPACAGVDGGADTAADGDLGAQVDGELDAVVDGGESVAITSSCVPPTLLDLSELVVAQDVVYATAGGEEQRLDFVAPIGAGPFPLVVLIHGGGWSSGDKRSFAPLQQTLASAGYATASLNYRLVTASSNTFPAAVEDVRCAVRYLRANASLYHLEPARIAALGGSAGGHLASMLGTASDVDGLDGACPYSESVALRAVISMAGPQDLRDLALLGDNPTIDPVATLTAFLGGLPSDDPAKAALASPIVHVNALAPPFLFIHGTADDAVPIGQSEAMLVALRASGVPVTLVSLEGVSHGNATGVPILSAPSAEQQATVSCTVFAFLAQRL